MRQRELTEILSEVGASPRASAAAVSIAKGAAVMMKVAMAKMVTAVVLLLAFLAGAGVLWAQQDTQPAATQPKDNSLLKTAMQTRLAALQNVSAEYLQATTYTPENRPPAPSGMQPAPIYEGRFGYIESFSFLSGLAKFEATLDEATIEKVRKDGWHRDLHSIEVFCPDHKETLSEVPPRRLTGSIRADGGLRNRLVSVDVSLGLREAGSEAWLDAKSLDAMGYRRDSSGLIEVSHRLANGKMHTWHFDPKVGYAMVSYSWGNTEIVASDFKQVQGVMLPFTVTAKSFSDGRRTTVLRTDLFTITKYVLNDEANTKNRYKVQWPEGSLGYSVIGKSRTLWVAEKEAKLKELGSEEYMKLEKEMNAQSGE